MSFKTIDREMQTLLANGALKKLSPAELLQTKARFKGKVVVITGAGSGLGRGFAVHAAKNGASVVIGDVNQAGLDETVRLIAAIRGTVSAQLCDVTSWDEQVSLFQLAIQRYGKVDTVVANAGISDTNVHEWTSEPADDNLKRPNTKTLDVDIVGVVYTARIGLHYMRKNPAKEGKSLILIASYAAFYGSPLTVLYATSKHAVLGLGRALRYVTINDGINCVTLCPYFIDTPITAPIQSLVGQNARSSIDDFVHAASYASTSTLDELVPGTLVFVHPRGVLIGQGKGQRPTPIEVPRL